MRFKRAVRRDDGGFILIVALLAVIGLSLIAVDLGRRSAGATEAAAVEAGLIEAGFASDAGLARALAALSDDTDPYFARLMTANAGMSWQFGQARIGLRIEAESGKVDLMVGEIELILGVVEALVDDDAARSEIMRRVKALRRGQVPFHTVAAILPPPLRITPLAARLGECLTVFSGQTGVDPLAAPPLVRRLLIGQRVDLLAPMAESVRTGRIAPDLAAALGSRMVIPRPLYTVDVEARIPSGIVSRQSVLVLLSPGQAPEVLRRLDAPPSDMATAN